MRSKVTAFDIEIYPNYVLFMFRDVVSDRVRYFENPEGDEAILAQMRTIVQTETLITFNGKGFDFPLLVLAMLGRSTGDLYEACKKIIEQNMKWWNFEKVYKVKIEDEHVDHIDLIEVAPLTGSLKLYGGRMHSKSIQDLPIPPGSIITADQIELLRTYCRNDLQTTVDLFNALKEQLILRESMTAQYGIDLRSKSDAQIAEAVLIQEIQKITKKKVDKPKHNPGDKFKYKIPAWMTFDHTDILSVIAETTFEVGDKGSVVLPKELQKKDIVMGSGTYRMGIGGLHSKESRQVKEADAEWMIIDVDVTSYYPAIVLNEGLYPAHIGETFLHVYRTIVERRLEAKRNKQKAIAESLKITANGTFGKLGSKWSALYSPDLMVQVTVTGQLAVLMLVESFWGIEGVEVISANTDGVTIRCRREVEKTVLEHVALWESMTGFSLERSDYVGLYSRDVNNYIAIKTDGEVKVKGIYGKGLPLHKNPNADICSTAVINHLHFGADLETTIRLCQDVRQFVVVKNVAAPGAMFRGESVGRVCRWYYTTEEGRYDVKGHPFKPYEDPYIGYAPEEMQEEYKKEELLAKEKYESEKDAFHYKINGNRVAGSTGGKPLMKINDYREIPADLDYGWYVREAEERLAWCQQEVVA